MRIDQQVTHFPIGIQDAAKDNVGINNMLHFRRRFLCFFHQEAFARSVVQKASLLFLAASGSNVTLQFFKPAEHL
jgi:hypothetical protein